MIKTGHFPGFLVNLGAAVDRVNFVGGWTVEVSTVGHSHR